MAPAAPTGTTRGARWRRWPGVAAVVALAVTVLGAPAAGAQVRDPAVVCADEPGPRDRFADVVGTTFADEIACLGDMGVVAGGVGGVVGRYAPAAPVTRGQMATILANLLDQHELRQPRDEVPALPHVHEPGPFADVADTHPHAPAINRLANVDVVAGGVGGVEGRYAPDAPVDRGQMASALRHALAFTTGVEHEAAAAGYPDVPGAHPHAASIAVVTDLGIAQGDGGRYRPGAHITRGQMAAMVARTVVAIAERGTWQATTRIAELVDVRVGSFPDGDGTTDRGFDRVVLEFDEALPMSRVHPADPPFVDTAGDVVAVAGAAHLRYLSPFAATARDDGAGGWTPTYHGPRRIGAPAGAGVVTEVVLVQSFEATLSWVVGLRAEADYTVHRHAGDPHRITIDVHHHP
jgi:hypothetical protein